MVLVLTIGTLGPNPQEIHLLQYPHIIRLNMHAARICLALSSQLMIRSLCSKGRIYHADNRSGRMWVQERGASTQAWQVGH